MRQTLGMCLLLLALLGGCSAQQWMMRRAADALASQGQSPEDDLQLAREASAFYLKLSEAVLREQPDHEALALAVSSGFVQYAYAFVGFEADRLDSSDAKAAKRQRQRAARLYLRAQQHALRALQARLPDLTQALSAGLDPGLVLEQVPLAHWAATSWAALISLSKDEPERVAELPQVLQLARAADALDPTHSNGALASLLGTLEASRPGGSVIQARRYFDRAYRASEGREAGVFLAEAESLASNDRMRFELLLRQSLAVARTNRTLANEVIRERAQWLLDTLDDRF